jgi:hypothetical protein
MTAEWARPRDQVDGSSRTGVKVDSSHLSHIVQHLLKASCANQYAWDCVGSSAGVGIRLTSLTFRATELTILSKATVALRTKVLEWIP